ncbi:SAM-dependent DNA methyltransferase [Streptomyces sp. ISL-22]|uniref:type I restriction-modification system subunit M n=1 Tax=unclassified Streptomyces TaxID=2593676 RepID=UPI001BE71974|nr:MULTISPECIES: class I SAM-dependent DNA methyltransferase [unclassified Streptomyces]MBT2418038.1 SAM-dependent DNA methyltransferase [Streptomyces sp. ISL-24]MBT2432287.1 SAM-dependent DNA methyltransferase [Streptomyces sp. ISL-22]
MNSSKHTELANHIWSVADLLRGDYKQSEYGKVILPFTVLRRLECVLEPTKNKVIEQAELLKGQEGIDADLFLRRASGHTFYNSSTYTLKKIAGDAGRAAEHLIEYIGCFSPNAREVLEKYEFARQIDKLDEAKLLYKVVSRFADLDLRPVERDEVGEIVLDDKGQPKVVVSNHQMGYIFEELIRRFAEQSNETAGEHFTPREVIELMVNLLIAPDEDALTMPKVVRTVLDPACGTGGMLTAAEEHIRAFNPDAKVVVYGQELNPESWAICRSDLMIKGQDPDNIKYGNSFNNDGHKPDAKDENKTTTFDYILANPPFGVEWKKVKDDVEWEHETLGESGRFGAGLPRINDGSLLFLQHMLSKRQPAEWVPPQSPDEPGHWRGGSRIAIVFNGSPLFTGAAESGESKIRQWILENDWLEGIVALPDQLFYNTGISTYFWILTNRKTPGHQGKVILLDAREHFVKMRKSLGDKRKMINDQQIKELTRLYGEALDVATNPEHLLHSKVKVFKNEDFGYHRITVERPLKLRFEVTEGALTALAAAKPVQMLEKRSEFIDALKSLIGQRWPTKAEAWVAMKDAVVAAGLTWPTGAPFNKALRDAVGVRDLDGEVQTKKGGTPEPDPELRDYENVPLEEDVEEYLKREVLPHVPDAWIDHDKTKVGYEIPFTRHFYAYEPPRPLAEIDEELKALEAEIQALLGKVTS